MKDLTLKLSSTPLLVLHIYYLYSSLITVALLFIFTLAIDMLPGGGDPFQSSTFQVFINSPSQVQV